MQTTTLSFANLHNHGELFANILRARRQSFIVQNQWKLPEAMGMEYDQYDTPASRWIAVHNFGEVLAGVRLTPTIARCGIYSYMIRDAQQGFLDSIPADLLHDKAPVCDTVWEASRVFVDHNTPAHVRRQVHFRLYSEMLKTARELGAARMLAIIQANWPRWTRRCGMEVSEAGPVRAIDGIDHQCVSINLATKLH